MFTKQMAEPGKVWDDFGQLGAWGFVDEGTAALCVQYSSLLSFLETGVPLLR